MLSARVQQHVQLGVVTRSSACTRTLAPRCQAQRTRRCAYNYSDWGPYSERRVSGPLSDTHKAFLDALSGGPSDWNLDFERTYHQHRRRQAILPLETFHEHDDDDGEGSSTTDSASAGPECSAGPAARAQQQPDHSSTIPTNGAAPNGDELRHFDSELSSSSSSSSSASFWAYLRYHQQLAPVDGDGGPDLLKAAVLIARHAFPDACEEQCRQHISEVASMVAQQLPPSSAGDSRGLAAVHAMGQVLFQELGFKGNSDDFYLPHNSCINWALERRTGSPAMLVLIYMLVAQELGLQARPVLLPSHTFVAPQAGSSPLLVDPFNGGQVCSLSVTEARLNNNWGFHSPLLHLDSGLQQALLQGSQCGARQLLGRLLANLREAYWAPLPHSGRLRWHLYSDDQLHHQCPMLHRALAVVRYQRATEPACLHRLRDEGLVLACMGRRQEGAVLLQRYLELEPAAPDRASVLKSLHACSGPGPWPESS